MIVNKKWQLEMYLKELKHLNKNTTIKDTFNMIDTMSNNSFNDNQILEHKISVVKMNIKNEKKRICKYIVN